MRQFGRCYASRQCYIQRTVEVALDASPCCGASVNIVNMFFADVLLIIENVFEAHMTYILYHYGLVFPEKSVPSEGKTVAFLLLLHRLQSK